MDTPDALVVRCEQYDAAIEDRDLDHDADEDAILEKPVDPGEFVEVIRSFEQFRLAILRED